MTAYVLPEPRDWTVFEDLCRDVFSELWQSPNALKHGRQGQPQAGVDVFGMLPDSGDWFGVQCKQKLDQQVTEKELREEVEKAKLFNPRLKCFVLATTAKRDVKVQEWARRLTETSPFEVSVYAWEDICETLTGRDELLQKHFRDIFRPISELGPAKDVLEAFQRQEWSRLLPLPSFVLRDTADLLLTDVYTSLDVTAMLRAGKTQRLDSDKDPTPAVSVSLPGEPAYLQGLRDHAEAQLKHRAEEHDASSYERRCRVLEAVAANRRLVLLGEAGSGKSTFGRFLAVNLLGESLRRPEANLARLDPGSTDEPRDAGGFVAWPHGAPLTFFVELRHLLAGDSFPKDGSAGEARHLVDFLVSRGPADGFRAFVHDALKQANGALVILDGLDETPATQAKRMQLKAVICAFARAYPDCRLLVTSRPYAYTTKSPWRLDDAGFADVELAPFDQGQQQAFVDAWYSRLVARHLLDVLPARKDELVRELTGQLGTVSYLQPLAERPLMLTMMADLHATCGGRLPAGGRAGLYRHSIELLLDRWNESRYGERPSEMLGMPLEQIQEALQLLAFRVHRSRGADSEKATEIDRTEVWEALADTRQARGHQQTVDHEKIMRYLHERSGILVGESEKIYRFPHRSYQEFMAASHLLDHDFPTLLEQVIEEDPVLWREVVQLAVGQQVKPSFMAWTILERLVPEPPPDDLATADAGCYRALLAGLAVRECELWQQPSTADRPKLERIRLWLRRIVEVGALDVKDRAEAGQVLGLLGDDRPGVGVGSDGLPDIEWVEVPAGEFTMGGERHDYEKPVHQAYVDGFKISRYPVTNAQYQVFVDDGGYSDRWRECWTDVGWSWKKDRDLEEPYYPGTPYDLPNHPRVVVSWYEAVAYCAWLTKRIGQTVRLPTEAEWERAARGEDGREYPWGPTFGEALCNSAETGIGATTAVGLFPKGEGPAGILDASGNVWEWCSTKWRETYEEKADDELAEKAVRVARGGSFANLNFFARCASRLYFVPDAYFDSLGFRLAAPMKL